MSPLKLAGYVDLPAHTGKGGFDHADVHAATGHVYVAHTANSTIDVFDPRRRQFLHSIADLPSVAGALVSNQDQLVFASNRAANTLGVFAPGANPEVKRFDVGLKPNGIAYDAARKRVLVANIGDPAIAGSHTLTMIDLGAGTRTEVPLPGSTRWSVYDKGRELFYVNISQPSQIVVVDAKQPDRIARTIPVAQAGAHGLDLDGERLFCACDSGVLVTFDASSGKVLNEGPLSGRPDVTWFNRQRKQLYVAVGDPGVIDVFSTETMQRLAVVPTERGAHTTAISPDGDWICAFLPETHRAAMYEIGA